MSGFQTPRDYALYFELLNQPGITQELSSGKITPDHFEPLLQDWAFLLKKKTETGPLGFDEFFQAWKLFELDLFKSLKARQHFEDLFYDQLNALALSDCLAVQEAEKWLEIILTLPHPDGKRIMSFFKALLKEPKYSLKIISSLFPVIFDCVPSQQQKCYQLLMTLPSFFKEDLWAAESFRNLLFNTLSGIDEALKKEITEWMEKAYKISLENVSCYEKWVSLYLSLKETIPDLWPPAQSPAENDRKGDLFDTFKRWLGFE